VLYYCNNIVWTKHIENPNGFRIYYGDGDLANQLESLPLSLLEAVSSLLQSVSAFCLHGMVAKQIGHWICDSWVTAGGLA